MPIRGRLHSNRPQQNAAHYAGRAPIERETQADHDTQWSILFLALLVVTCWLWSVATSDLNRLSPNADSTSTGEVAR